MNRWLNEVELMELSLTESQTGKMDGTKGIFNRVRFFYPSLTPDGLCCGDQVFRHALRIVNG